MISSHMFFCESCGAANTDDATVCFACQHPLDPLAGSTTFVASPVVIAPAPASVQVTVQGPVSSYSAQSGNVLKHRYQIVSELGQGGFGVVYNARDMDNHNRFVAVKQINLDRLSGRQVIEATDSYNREVAMLSRLDHKNLPRVLDHFSDSTHWYLVMEYIEGETLEAYLNRKGSLSVKETLEIGVQLANVLEYLHIQNPPIIFRDVKPGNIMRTSDNHLYLIDFGIARLFNPEKKRDTGALGSPGYAAPEQYGRAQSTRQTDIYGLGATLNTLLLGDDTSSASGSRLHSPARIPRKLQRLLDQMLEPDARKRPADMRAVMQRLQSMQHNTRELLGRYAKTCLWSALIGSFPYPLFLLYYFVMRVPFAHAALGAPVEALSQLFFFLWPLALIMQFVSAIIFIFTPRRRLLGLGIIVTMILCFLTLAQGVLPIMFMRGW